MTKGRPQFSKNFNAIFYLLKLPTFIANKPHMPGSNSSVNTPIQLLRTTLVLLAICRRLPGPALHRGLMSQIYIKKKRTNQIQLHQSCDPSRTRNITNRGGTTGHTTGAAYDLQLCQSHAAANGFRCKRSWLGLGLAKCSRASCVCAAMVMWEEEEEEEEEGWEKWATTACFTMRRHCWIRISVVNPRAYWLYSLSAPYSRSP